MMDDEEQIFLRPANITFFGGPLPRRIARAEGTSAQHEN
jgi:hypothetical protein